MSDLTIWSGNRNNLAAAIYSEDNMQERSIGNGDKCYIFFSSNDIYFPDTEEAFRESIINKNRYEWSNIARTRELTSETGKMVFVRDIYKQWYVTGINCSINTHDKLIDRLKVISSGYRVITIGSSAGGYMAMLAGAMLKAEACFCFSGQVVLNSLNLNFIVQVTGNRPEELPYYDIRPLIRESACRFYYFYPALNDEDKKIYECIKEYDNVYGFGYNQKNHAATMMNSNMRYIVCKNKDFMFKLHKRYGDRIINYLAFYFYTVPIYMWIPLGIRELRSFIKRKIRLSRYR